MLRIYSLLCCVSLLLGSAAAETIVPGGNVLGTWTSTGSPYIVQGDITIQAADSLIILPGVEIRFEQSVNLVVYGHLRADGTTGPGMGDSISFTSNPQPGSWGSLRIINGGRADLTFCTFDYGSTVWGYDNNSFNFNDCRFSMPISGEPYLPTFNRCLFTNDQTFTGGRWLVMRSCIINGILDFDMGSGSSFTVDSCSIAEDLWLYDYAATFNVSASSIGENVYFEYHATAYLTNCQIQGQVLGGDNLYINNCTIYNGISIHNIDESGHLYLDNSQVYGILYIGDRIYNDVNGNTIIGNIELQSCMGLNLLNNSISGSLTGYISPMDGALNVRNNTITNGKIHVRTDFTEIGAQVVNNQILNSPGDGIRLISTTWQGGNSISVINNTVYAAAGNGITVIDSGSTAHQIAFVYNNIVSNCGGYGIFAANLDSLYLAYNDVWACNSGLYYGVTPGAGSINIDPLFVNPAAGDFHLQSQQGSYHNGQWLADSHTSPCIDAGDPASAYASEPEPNGDRINLGFEGNTTQASLTYTLPTYSGPVSGVWTVDNSPYYISGDVYVANGQTLTIQPGVEVLFMGHYKFNINGALNALGTESDSIRFSTVNPDSNWHGLRFSTANDTCHFAYCILEHGYSWGGEVDHEGGAVYSDRSNTVFSNCRISHNSAMTGGGFAFFWYSHSILDHCLIDSNYADWGGGIFTEEFAQVDITNSTIIKNTGTMMGGGIRATGQSNMIILNSIVAGNFGNGGVHWGITQNSSINYSDFYNNEDGDFVGTFPAGTGILSRVNANRDSSDTYLNIILNPQFADTSAGDYHLLANSPCIDAGNRTSPLDPDLTTTDIGAFYFDQTPQVSVTLTPINPPIQIPANGGSFQYDINVHNTGTTPVNMDIWIMMKLLPNGNWTGPYLMANRTLGSGANPTRLRTQFISSGLATGTYIYEGRVGDYPNTIWSFSNFTFEKLAVDDGGPWVLDFANTGLDLFDEFIPVVQVEIPTEYSLSQNYPNPFNPETTISFGLPTASRVNLSVYDIAGRLVTTIVNGWREAGNHQVTYNGAGLPSGVYIYRLQAGEFTASGKMIYLK
ncbi:MAG: right-handed parallel beta-helix repeat-containing protein [bacterium]|nr:right-handed parallel beta-helix repeat-containing protein [bacterium]